MRSFKWSTSDAVFVAVIDDEHKAIFDAVAELQRVLALNGSGSELRKPIQRLTSCVTAHFAHEERLMRAARYGSMQWHKRSHDSARRRVGEFVLRIEKGDTKAGFELIDYLASWLHDHTCVADQMMAAFLRNEQRCMGRVTFRASTKPIDSCAWIDANGNRLDPRPESGL